MDLLRVGRSLRALRIRRGLRQSDVATSAGLSRSQVARIERGEIGRVPVTDVLSVAVTLGADLEMRVHWHGEALDRLLDGAHAALTERTIRLLDRYGWESVVEASFNVYGERGTVDILAFHRGMGVVLVVEIKSVIPDVQSLLGSHDRKARLALRIGRDRGWGAKRAARLLVVAASSTSRRRVELLKAVFETAYPQGFMDVRRWLHSPEGPMSGLMFLPNDQGSAIGRSPVGRQRVQPSRRAQHQTVRPRGGQLNAKTPVPGPSGDMD